MNSESYCMHLWWQLCHFCFRLKCDIKIVVVKWKIVQISVMVASYYNYNPLVYIIIMAIISEFSVVLKWFYRFNHLYSCYWNWYKYTFLSTSNGFLVRLYFQEIIIFHSGECRIANQYDWCLHIAMNEGENEKKNFFYS